MQSDSFHVRAPDTGHRTFHLEVKSALQRISWFAVIRRASGGDPGGWYYLLRTLMNRLRPSFVPDTFRTSSTSDASVWNRMGFVRDPETGRRVSRSKSELQLIARDVPEFRIVDQDLWDQVQARLTGGPRIVGADNPEPTALLGAPPGTTHAHREALLRLL